MSARKEFNSLINKLDAVGERVKEAECDRRNVAEQADEAFRKMLLDEFQVLIMNDEYTFAQLYDARNKLISLVEKEVK